MRLRVGAAALALLLAAPAAAQPDEQAPAGVSPLEARGLLAEAMLLESGSGDYVAACARYDALLEQAEGLPEGLVSEAWLRLGLARETLAGVTGPDELILEQVEQAEAAYRVILERFPATQWADDARYRLQSLEEYRKRVRRFPIRFDFTEDVGGLFHARSRSHKGRLTHESAPDGEAGGVAAWRTYVISGEDDLLMVGFAGRTPETASVGLRVRATAFPAHLAFFLIDEAGSRRATAVTRVQPDEGWKSLRFADSDFQPARSGDARPLRYLMIQDLTGHSSTDRGENLILLDDLSLD